MTTSHPHPAQNNDHITELIDRVMEVVVDFYQSEEAFTILDISEKVKTDGGPFVRHRDVHAIAKPILNSLIESEILADFTSTDITVNTNDGPKWARLYHTTHFNPDNYTRRNLVAATPTQTNKDDSSSGIMALRSASKGWKQIVNKNISLNGTAPQTSQPSIPGAHLDIQVKVRSDGCIEIPLKILRESGLQVSAADVYVHPASITIQKSTNGSPLTLLMREGVRLRKQHLVNLDLSKPVRMAAFTDKIVVYQP